MCGFFCIAKPRSESRIFLAPGGAFFAFYGLYFRNRYYRCLRELFLCGLADDPVTCGGEEEFTLFIGVHIAGNIVIVITGRVMNFTPVVIMVGTVFVDDFCFRLFLSPQFDDVDIFVNGKINEDFVVCLMNDSESGVG